MTTRTARIVTGPSLADLVLTDLRAAHFRLSLALIERKAKDTPAHAAAVADREAELDTLLDLLAAATPERSHA